MAEIIEAAAVAAQIRETRAETALQEIVLTGYQVTYVDLREPKPRAKHTEIFPVDSEWIKAANYMGLNVTKVIEHKYETGGYVVQDIMKVPGKRVCVLDMSKLWDEAGPLHKEPAAPAEEAEGEKQ